MATDTFTRNDYGVPHGVTGTTTGDGTALTVTLGFKPMQIVLINLTDAIRWEKIDGMSDAQTLKTVTAGTTTTDATSAIVITDNGFTATAALNASAKALVWYAA